MIAKRKDAPDWDAIWSNYVQQSDAHEVEAANDNTSEDHEREPSGFGLAVVLIVILVVGMACIGAIR